MHRWLLLVYKVSPTPSANRVYVWRKLKQLGAVLLHDAVWVLPATERTAEQFQWLAAEITEMQGDAMLWEGELKNRLQEDRLVQQFMTQVDKEYESLLAELQRANPDLNGISRQYQQVKLREHFPSTLGEQVRNALLSTRDRASGEEIE